MKRMVIGFVLVGALAPVLLTACATTSTAGQPRTSSAATPTQTSATKSAAASKTTAATSASSGGTPVTLENPTTTPSGLKYVDTVVGTGASPTMDQTVTVRYTGKLASNGQVFDSSGSNTVSFPMNGVIKGFSEALSTMKVGGKRTVLIPSALGYGPNGYGPIPPNADLVFDLELVAVK